MTKRILIVSYHFYPDTAVGAKRMSELARYLCDQGHEVVVVSAASARYLQLDPELELEVPGLRCIRVPQPTKLSPLVLNQIKRLRRRGEGQQPGAVSGAGVGNSLPERENTLQRLKRVYHSLEWLVDDKKLWASLVALRLVLLSFGKPFDVVISSGPPMTAHLAVWAARPMLRCRWIADLRDPWTDQDHWRLHIQSAISRRANRSLERRVFASADAISVTTPGYARTLRKSYPARQDQIFTVLNGFEGIVEPSQPPQGRLDLLYAGSLYYNRDPFPLLRALGRLVEQPEVDRSRVRFRLFGDCAAWGGTNLTEWIAQHGLHDCVSVHPPVSVAEIRQLMVESNVLVNFAQGQPMQIPAKMFEYIAARREMLLITENDSDSAWLARQAGSANIVTPGDENAALEALGDLYRKYVVNPQQADLDPSRLLIFGRANQNARFLELLTGEIGVQQEAGL